MVLNGKAELMEKSFGPRTICNDRVELYTIVAMLAASTFISFRLYLVMEDGWQTNTHLRWQVFSLSIALLVLSVTACLYLCRRHRPTVYLHSTRERSLESVNSQVHLVNGEQPPNYSAVHPKILKDTSRQTTYGSIVDLKQYFKKGMDAEYLSPPSLYNSVFNV